jgi:hypothetical protein
MSRKTSLYARKHAGKVVAKNDSWAKVIRISRPFDETAGIGSGDVGLIGESVSKELHDAIDRILQGTEPADSFKAHDSIAHCLGIAQIRAFDMGGDAVDDILDSLHDAVYALKRCTQRKADTGKWGFDGPAIEQMKTAAKIYDMILFSSSPLQMEHAQMVRLNEIRQLQRQSAPA